MTEVIHLGNPPEWLIDAVRVWHRESCIGLPEHRGRCALVPDLLRTAAGIH